MVSRAGIINIEITTNYLKSRDLSMAWNLQQNGRAGLTFKWQMCYYSVSYK
jgi:hypothetical protein